MLGNIVKVTPTSKAVGDLAIFMYKNNLNKDNILTAGASLSYPDSVVSYFRGMMGQPYGGFPKELQKIVLKDIEPLTERPGKLLPPEDLEGIKKHLIEKYHYEDKSEEVLAQKAISYALYPKVYEDYCEHFEMYNDVTRLESHVYFYGLRKGEETYLKIGEGKELLIYNIGRKGHEALERKGYEIAEDYSEVINAPLYSDAVEISQRVLKDFEEEKIGEIYLVYTSFKNTVVHEPKLLKLLPVEFSDKELSDVERNTPMNYKPGEEEALDMIIPKYIASLLYGALNEAAASENGARMQAMDAATSNAEDMMESLELQYNRARQGSITQELTEIIAGAEAVE